MLEGIIHQDEVFYRGLLDPPSEIQRIGFEPLVPAGLLVAEVDDRGRLEGIQRLLLTQLVQVEILRVAHPRHDCLQLPRTLHAQEVALVLDVGHGDPEFGAIDVVAGLLAVVVELVDRPCSIAPQLAQVGGVVLVHLLGETDVVVASNASTLILAEEDGPLVFAHGLVVLAEA